MKRIALTRGHALRAATTLTVATMIAASGIASKASNASTPVRELPESFMLAGLSGFDRWSDDPHPLKPGAVYTAHNLPVPIRLTIQGGGANLTPSEFPSFADSAERLLRTLRFPR